VRTLFKGLIYTLLALVVVLGGLVVYLTQFFDANSYKPLIIEQADNAGVPLELNGEIEVTVFPWLGASIQGVKVLHPTTRDSQKPFAEVNKAGVKLKLLPLLSGNIEVDRVVLDGLYADIVIDAQGQGNWQAFIPANDSTPGTATTTQTEKSTSPALALAVAGIDITNTRLNFTDHSQSLSAQIKQLDLHSDSIALKKMFPLQIKTEVTSSNPDLKAKLELNSQVYLDLEQQLYQLEQLQINLQAQSPTLGNTPVNLSLNTSVKANMQDQRINISQLALKLRDLALQSADLPQLQANLDLNLPSADLNLANQAYRADNLNLKLYALTPLVGPTPFELSLQTSAAAVLKTGDVQISALKLNIDGLNYQQPEGLSAKVNLAVNSSAALNLQQETYQLTKLTADGDIETSLTGDKPLKLQLITSADANLKQQTAELKPSQLVVDDITITLQALAKQILDSPQVDGAIRIDEFSPKAWFQRLHITLPEMADPSVLSSLSLVSRLELKGSDAGIKDLQLKADQSTLTGQAGINLDNQAMFAQLNLDRINLDRYLPPEPKEDEQVEQTPAPTEPTPSEETDLIPVEVLKPLQAKAKITLTELIVKKHPISDIVLSLDANKGLIKLKAANAKLYEGQITNSGALNLNKTPIQMQFSHKTQGIRLNPLLTTAAEFNQMTGTTHLTANMKTQTNRMSSIMANLNGAANFNILDGAFLGTNISREICDALSGEPQVDSWSKNTDFTSIAGNIEFIQGVGNNKNMTLAIPGIKMTGHGQIDLPKSTFDYNLGAQLTNAHEKVCRIRRNLRSIRWPVACKGSYGEPFDINCGLDIKAIGGSLGNIAEAEAKAALDKEKARLKAKLKEEEDKLKAKVEEEAKKSLEKALKKLF